ncbi:type 2a phosphatase activator tip41 [Moniliophthora roreri MCA 2997]|uniref:Type 2a phosphatase activator tip41 n=1 Tax=Moniliophthora roreri (strain MCA 2997) TaxID=1381753 RepID=V2XQM8_MONRO|nr:type 2a phosphatase activator tip41 [Moniliophthora roreri MCA 2997]
MAAAAVALPEHKLFESPNSRSIRIGDWYITASTNPISNHQECEVLNALLSIPLPEMTFGRNILTLHHRRSGWRYTFSVEDALKAVKRGELEPGDGGVKVNYADAWLKSRTSPSSLLPMPETVPTKPYDWTYTTIYTGHTETDSRLEEATPFIPTWHPSDPENPSQQIPLSELTRPDPILFYAEIPLFEDELHDNGSSGLLVRIRVMPTCIFILARFTLRVDNVLFRTFDTRIYHSFASNPPTVVRETCGWEAPYDRVKNLLPKRDDLTPLTDPTFIAKILSELPKGLSQKDGARTGWRGLRRNLEYTVLA